MPDTVDPRVLGKCVIQCAQGRFGESNVQSRLPPSGRVHIDVSEGDTPNIQVDAMDNRDIEIDELRDRTDKVHLL